MNSNLVCNLRILENVKKKLSIFFIVIATMVQAQDFGVGTWREHLPYNNVVSIAKVGTTTYAATEFALYSIDADENVERLNKINALSDLSINVIQENSSQNALVIGYKSGNIDLLKDGRIINLSSIIISNIVGDKAIYGMHNDGQYAYLACGFGIVVLDVKNEEIKDTYIIGSGGAQLKINDITIDASYIYAATDDGIYKANKTSPFLSDFTVWSKDTSIPNDNGEYSIIHLFDNSIYTNLEVNGVGNDTIYYFDGVWNAVAESFGHDYYSIEEKDNDIVTANNDGLSVFNASNQIIEAYYYYNGTVAIRPNQIIWDGDYFWVGDGESGATKMLNDWVVTKYSVSGPFSNDVFHMAFSNDLLWVATGRVDGTNWNSNFNKRGVYVYDQFDWDMVNEITDPAMQIADTLFDFIQVTIDPTDENHIFASSFQGGIVEIQDKAVINRFTFYNSSLQTSLSHSGDAVKVAGSAFDVDGNFWVANSFVNEPLSVYTEDGTWLSFNCGTAASNMVCTDLMIDKNYGYIWMTVKNVGLLVYDFNDTPLDNSDDQYKLIASGEGNGNLPSKVINTLVEDKDGEIWIGTEAGPAVMYNASSIFDGGNFDVQQVLIEQDGVIQLLLETQNIIEIVVDGGDRKWFGTDGGGLFLMSADGTELIHDFTKENSALFSDNILALAMNDNTGELYIGTDKGIMGYKGEATKAADNLDDLYAYPNPVRPEYTGVIAIKGFMDESDVKITDASGNLVFSTISKGGQAIWDGNNLQGERVKSGVYYCFAVSRTATQKGFAKASTKIMFIN